MKRMWQRLDVRSVSKIGADNGSETSWRSDIQSGVISRKIWVADEDRRRAVDKPRHVGGGEQWSTRSNPSNDGAVDPTSVGAEVRLMNVTRKVSAFFCCLLHLLRANFTLYKPLKFFWR